MILKFGMLKDWKKHLNRHAKKGGIAGWIDEEGYIQIGLLSKHHKAHRLAWLYAHGEMPNNNIDHINCIKTDNRIENLRLANKSQNGMNRGKQKNNTTGFKGVCKETRTGKYKPYATVNGLKHNFSSYNTAEEASQVYKEFIKHHHGEFMNCE
jgi:hypothetical protein